jgi:hypothetical protein
MFGKPQWFRPKTIGWGLTPITWQGWVYTVVWAAVMIVPFVGLISSARWLEGSIWLAASIGALTWDVAAILREINTVEEDVLIIDDDVNDSLATKNYDLRSRK